MKRRRLALAGLLGAAACTAVPGPQAYVDPAAFVPARLADAPPDRAVEIVETALPLPLPGQLKPLAPPRKPAPSSPVAAIAEGASAARIEPSTDGYVNAVQVYPYTEGALYQLYASPGQVSDIALQPGERLVSVSAGDTVRWVVGDTQSGSGAGARAHVLVKPVAAGLSTNLMIATDRRTYHLELTSLEKSYMAALSWRYPSDALANLTERNTLALAREETRIAAGLDLEHLDFGYRIEGARPAWRPLRVFDDGRQVFLQMPETLAATEAPPLFVLGAGGKAELVNYRVQGNYYIVDHLFAAAELRQGGRPQVIVRIRRIDPAGGQRK